MTLLLGALSVLATLASNVLAQQSSNSPQATCPSGTPYQWTFNSIGQSPCQVATSLGGVCTGGVFQLVPLPAGFVYQPPTLETANPCRCSSVYYSMMSACALCQGGLVGRWSVYDANCSTVYLDVFPQTIPNGTLVPNFAYNDVLSNDGFNVTLANSTTGPEHSGASPTATGGAAKSTSTSHHSDAGAIAGGVIGAVVGLAAIAGLAFWFVRRRRAGSVSATQTSGYSVPMRSDDHSALMSSPSPKLYDPSDPSTFPSSIDMSMTNPADLSYARRPFTESSRNSLSNVPRYTGAPEV